MMKLGSSRCFGNSLPKLTVYRLFACLGLTLIISVAAVTATDAAFFGLFKSRSKKNVVVIPSQSLVLFPFDQGEAAETPEEYGGEVAAYLRTMLAGNSEYAVFLYSDRLPPIRRGRDDNSLKTSDIKPPFTGGDEEARARSLKLARTLAADFYLVGAVDGYEFDPAGKTAEVTLTAELVDGKTGKIKGRFVVTGMADETCKATDEDEYRAVAAGKAVEALKEQILPKPEAEKQPESAPGKEENEAPGESAPAAAE